LGADTPISAGRVKDAMTLLALNSVSKSFGAIKALTDVDFAVAHGEIVGLMGDNGAGKSTLVKVIAGNFPPSSGEIILDDKSVHFHKPVEARQQGIEVVYQDLALCNNLSASANVFLGREIKKSIGPIRWLNRNAMNKRAGELFAELKSETRPRHLVPPSACGRSPKCSTSSSVCAIPAYRSC
jgi:simple sugar transport system ATP-binding protein